MANIQKQVYLTPVQVKALQIMAAMENTDHSAITREALEKHIPEKYMKMAKEQLKGGET